MQVVVVVVLVGGGGFVVVVVVVRGGGAVVVVVVVVVIVVRGGGAVVVGDGADVVGVPEGADTRDAPGAAVVVGAGALCVLVVCVVCVVCDTVVVVFDVDAPVVEVDPCVVVVDDDDRATAGGGAVGAVCCLTRWLAALAGRVGLFACGVRTKATTSMAAMRPRPTHMPHWRVGDRSAVAAGAG
jgi:hypothetical protein